jgi:hypothetical protein
LSRRCTRILVFDAGFDNNDILGDLEWVIHHFEEKNKYTFAWQGKNGIFFTGKDLRSATCGSNSIAAAKGIANFKKDKTSQFLEIRISYSPTESGILWYTKMR